MGWINPQIPPPERRYGLFLMAMYLLPTVVAAGIVLVLLAGWYPGSWRMEWLIGLFVAAYVVRFLARRAMKRLFARLESLGVSCPEGACKRA